MKSRSPGDWDILSKVSSQNFLEEAELPVTFWGLGEPWKLPDGCPSILPCQWT